MNKDDLANRLINAPADGLGTENLCIEAADHIEELEVKLAKVMAELKVLVDVSTFMQSSAYYDKRMYQSVITDTVWSQWSKQLKFAKSTLPELKGQNDE